MLRLQWLDEVAKQIPFGTVIVNTTKGGLNINDAENDIVTVIASAAVAARLDIPKGKYIAGTHIAPDESYLMWSAEREDGYGGSGSTGAGRS